MYKTVPPAMDSSIWRFHRWRSMTPAMAMASGSPWVPDRSSTFFRQYTTSREKTAPGSNFPSRSITFGVALSAGKRRKGRNRVTSVPRAMMADAISTPS